jgi:hypothetical protein
MMSEERVEATAPIRLQYQAAGFEATVTFKGEGWKYKHLRLWEEAQGAGMLAEVISERIVGWSMPDGTPFEAGPEALDNLHPTLANWLVRAYRDAYNRAGMPDPNG